MKKLSATFLPLVVLAAAALGACSPGSSPSPTAEPTLKPTPTPIGEPIATIDEAARLVIASDPRFAGVTKLDPNLIGASAWWEGQRLEMGDYELTITIGWGDCPAGCINKHQWLFRVTPDAVITLVSETGDPLPAGTLPAY